MFSNRLEFNCLGPRTVEEVMYSIPHRILAIALRRGILADYDDLDSLLKYGKDALININFKEEALELPVILAAMPKGTDLLPNKPGAAHGISDYIQRIALSLGFPPGLTHYAWRRSAATNMARTIGTEATREMMGHTPDSRALESSYKLGSVGIDVFAISMGQPQASLTQMLGDDSLGVNRIKANASERANWIRDYVNSNKEYSAQQTRVAQLQAELTEEPTDAQVAALAEQQKVLKSFYRSLSRRGELAFQAVQHANTKARLTEGALEERRKEMMKPGKI